MSNELERAASDMVIEVIYVLTWRYSDGSGSGAVSAHLTKEGADKMKSLLEEQESIRRFDVQAVPFGRLP